MRLRRHVRLKGEPTVEGALWRVLPLFVAWIQRVFLVSIRSHRLSSPLPLNLDGGTLPFLSLQQWICISKLFLNFLKGTGASGGGAALTFLDFPTCRSLAFPPMIGERLAALLRGSPRSRCMKLHVFCYPFRPGSRQGLA